jgi:hypothetical protein
MYQFRLTKEITNSNLFFHKKQVKDRVLKKEHMNVQKREKIGYTKLNKRTTDSKATEIYLKTNLNRWRQKCKELTNLCVLEIILMGKYQITRHKISKKTYKKNMMSLFQRLKSEERKFVNLLLFKEVLLQDLQPLRNLVNMIMFKVKFNKIKAKEINIIHKLLKN